MRIRLASLLSCGVAVLFGCSEEIEGPSPTVEGLDPSLVCAEQLTTGVTISGAGLSPMAEDALTGDPLLALPTVTLARTASLDGTGASGPVVVVPDDPRDPEASRVRWTSRSSMGFDVFPDLLEPGAFDVTVTNPNGRSFTIPDALGAVPRPTVDSIEPDIICVAQGDQTVVVHGATLLRAGDALPQVAIGERVYTPEALDGCTDAPGPMEGAEICSEATVTIPRGDLPEGTHDVVVTNPNPAGCTSSDPVTIAVVPPPAIESIVPDLVCTEDGERVITVSGTGFLVIDGELPVVRVGEAEIDASSADGCEAVEGTIRDAESCTSLEVSLPAGALADGVLEPGAATVVVVNPPPADCTSNPSTIALVGPPVVDELIPDPICVEQGRRSVQLLGHDLLVVEDVSPSVTVDGVAAEVQASDGCSPVEGTTLAALTCTSLTILVAADLAEGAHDVVVTNPDPAGCSSVAAVLEVVPPPEVVSVAPSTVCSSSAEIVVSGSGFSTAPRVLLGDTEATVVAATPEEITVTALDLDVGVLDVTVDNGDGCSDTLADALVVTPGPSVYFADPPVVYSGIATQVTIYVSGIAAGPDSVSIQPAGGGDAIELDASFDPLRSSRVLAVVPAGLAAGAWDIFVSEGGCTAVLPGGLTVTDTLTVAVESIDPPFGWTEEDTPVTITASDPAPDGEVQFEATPRAYLNPDAAGPGTVATALGAVDFATATRLTAIVPDGLPAGIYDLIIVNPDGSVGLLDQAFTVAPTDAPPPTVDAVTPASVVNQSGQVLTVLGRAFRSPTVEAICRDDAGIETTVAGVMGATTDTTAEVTLDMSPFAGGAICVVRLTNDDGTWSEWSALAVTNPAQNLPATVPDDAMTVPRRAPATSAGRVTSQARFVYAIGGDDGTDGGVLSSVEAAPVDLFGDLGAWSELPLSLPEGRAMAGAAAVGRFVYVVGGRTATGATDSVLRAQILDPRDAPSFEDVVVEPGDGTGVAPGLWYYRVSAVMNADDPSNPGGETLASDPQAVVVPPLPEGVWLTLWWTPVANAAQYRVYRTPDPDGRVGDAVLVATVDAAGSWWQDRGQAAGVETPLPFGALGELHEVGPLTVEREGAGVVAAPDPGDPDSFFLYAIGGRDAAGNASRSYDVASVTIAADGGQTVGPFASGGNLLGVARWQLGAVAMDHTHAAVVPEGETWVFAMGGADAAMATVVRDVTAARVGADGLLTDIYEVDDMRSQAGYGYAGANGFLFTFGGLDAAPSNTAASAKLCAVGEGGCGGGGSPPEPPDLVNWNNLGFTIVEARYLPGSALESAFLFLIGGQTDLLAATTSVERTHW